MIVQNLNYYAKFIVLILQSSPPHQHPTPSKFRVLSGAVAGGIAGLCVGGPLVGLVGAILAAAVETWN